MSPNQLVDELDALLGPRRSQETAAAAEAAAGKGREAEEEEEEEEKEAAGKRQKDAREGMAGTARPSSLREACGATFRLGEAVTHTRWA